MKIRLLIACILLAGTAWAQDFEGTVRWSMKLNITDPKVRKQMAEAEAKMKDPATQQQMKQAMEQMNNPEFKKMMEANPQLKAQMETLMKSMQGGSMNSLIPTGISMKTKNGNVLSVMEGGMMAGMETLYLQAKKESYLINRDSKTYSVIPQDASLSTEGDPKITVKKTTETQKILGYTCAKTVVTVTEDKQTVTQVFWTTTEIKGLDFGRMVNQQTGQDNYTMYFKDLEGIPLKVDMTIPQGNVVMEATEVKKQTLPASDFQIPAGFKKTAVMGQ